MEKKSKINQNIHKFLQNMENLENSNILIGYSGGADSTLLLHILNEKKDIFKFNLKAVFFSHENSPINEGEDENLKLTKKICDKLNIDFIHKPLYLVKESQKSWEQLGRQHRMEFYSDKSFDFVFLGHHLDDQNETTMIQLFRGGGKGIVGMKSMDGKFCRPLLNITKKEIYNYLISNQLEWKEDPTNKDTDFTRNFWRQKVLPLISEHYPEYTQSLSLFRSKQKQQNTLMYDLAVIDGLKILLDNNSIEINNLSEERLNNLITHFGQSLQSNLETKKITNFLNHKTTTTNNTTIETHKFALTINYNKQSKIFLLQPNIFNFNKENDNNNSNNTKKSLRI